jgi:NAD(P)H-dependent flavin oxidoreductase YrpB (nitropropane dioxygenase family)
MQATRYTELVGCEVPVQLAPMGSVSTLELAAAVTSAGGHAMLGLTGVSVAAVTELCAAAEARGVRPYGVNFLVPFLDPAVLEYVAARVALVDFYLGPPDRALIEIVHAGGALAQWQVCSRSEAIAAEEAGCDAIVAHGVEAGGRNPGGIGLIPLLAEVLDAVRIPVLAAGGIATGRALAAVLAMGADGARVGTRFVAAAESDAHPRYVEALIAARPADTVYGRDFVYGWDAPGRVLRSSVEAAEAFAGEVVG